MPKNEVAKGLSEPAIQAQVRTAMRRAPSHRIDPLMPDHLVRLLEELDRAAAVTEEPDETA